MIEKIINRVLIDGDSCPVIEITEKEAEKCNCQLLVFTDYSHQIEIEYGEVIKIDTANQSVDMEIVNRAQSGDLIITQDYGLAALVLSRGAKVINFYGSQYTEINIDNLLMKRHLNAKMRRAGKKHPTHAKRTDSDDRKFRENLLNLIRD